MTKTEAKAGIRSRRPCLLCTERRPSDDFEHDASGRRLAICGACRKSRAKYWNCSENDVELYYALWLLEKSVQKEIRTRGVVSPLVESKSLEEKRISAMARMIVDETRRKLFLLAGLDQSSPVPPPTHEELKQEGKFWWNKQ